MDKITEQDLANRGVKGLPDVPGLTTEEMQRNLEEIAREILIPKVNELVEGLNNANSNFSELGTRTFYGWCILRVQGGVGYLYITDTNIKSTDTIAFNENLEIVGVVYKQLSSIVVTNRNGGFLVTITFDGMDNYNNSLVGFEYTVRRRI